MASNYIDELNELYNNRVFLNEKFSGAPVRPCMCGKREGEEAEECECNKEVPSQDDMVFAKKDVDDGYDHEVDFNQTGEHPEHQASNMVKQNLYRIAKMAAMLHDIIPCDSEIEEWVADKIAKAEGSINSVFGYKDYEAHKGEVERDIEIEEKTEQDLYKSINDGGESLINKIREIMRNQPKEKVEDALYGMIRTLEA